MASRAPFGGWTMPRPRLARISSTKCRGRVWSRRSSRHSGSAQPEPTFGPAVRSRNERIHHMKYSEGNAAELKDKFWHELASSSFVMLQLDGDPEGAAPMTAS